MRSGITRSGGGRSSLDRPVGLLRLLPPLASARKLHAHRTLATGMQTCKDRFSQRI